MKDVSATILGSLKACPSPNSNSSWLYAYELIVGAAASLLSADPYYAGTRHYGHKQHYNSKPKLLPTLLRKAYKDASRKRQPLNLYYDGLQQWTSGYFFNSAVVRVACAYEYTLSTACGNKPYENLDLKKHLGSLILKQPPHALEKQLEVFQSLPSRKALNDKVDDRIDKLVNQNWLSTEARVENICKRLRSKDDDFFEASLLFVWCDYNWFKHRPMGYPIQNHSRKDPRVQFALVLRAYQGLCELYSWCCKIPVS